MRDSYNTYRQPKAVEVPKEIHVHVHVLLPNVRYYICSNICHCLGKFSIFLETKTETWLHESDESNS